MQDELPTSSREGLRTFVPNGGTSLDKTSSALSSARGSYKLDGRLRLLLNPSWGTPRTLFDLVLIRTVDLLAIWCMAKEVSRDP